MKSLKLLLAAVGLILSGEIGAQSIEKEPLTLQEASDPSFVIFHFKVGLNIIGPTSSREQKDQAAKILAQLFPPTESLRETDGIYTVVSKEDIDMQALDAELQKQGITLTSLEKQQYDSDNRLVFILYYKPKTIRDPQRVPD